ncbi:MAG: glycosyltransferase family 2 protein [Caulobacterales bacterium]
MSGSISSGESVEISVVVPVYNEAGNVAALAAEIAQALDGRAYEMLFVDDASRDGTRGRLLEAKVQLPTLRVLGHRKNAGQSRAIRTGVKAARGPLIVTLDGDGQNDPKDLPRLIAQISRPDAPLTLALVQGRRLKRQDSFGKRIASRVANFVRKRLLNDSAEDSGCGIKVFKRSAYLDLPYFDHIHRYTPALMLAEGFSVEYADVGHRSRRHGQSKYTNLGRLVAAVWDLLGVMWLRSRRRNPRGADEL